MADSILTHELRTKFCPACKAETDHYASGACKQCARSRAISWNLKNVEKVRLRKSTWQAANRESERVRKFEWQRKNKLKVRASSASYRARNPERARNVVSAWAKANPEAVRVNVINRRAKQRENGGKLSTDIIQRLHKIQKGKCACCSQPLGSEYHLDHIMPIKLGGSNTDENMQLLSKRCNLQKSAKHPIDFMQSKGFLL